jgi:hypothetical protein
MLGDDGGPKPVPKSRSQKLRGKIFVVSYHRPYLHEFRLLTNLEVIVHSTFVSCLIALAVEIPFALFLSFWGIRRFAYYLSESEEVANITEHMWKVSSNYADFPFLPTPH